MQEQSVQYNHNVSYCSEINNKVETTTTHNTPLCWIKDNVDNIKNERLSENIKIMENLQNTFNNNNSEYCECDCSRVEKLESSLTSHVVTFPKCKHNKQKLDILKPNDYLNFAYERMDSDISKQKSDKDRPISNQINDQVHLTETRECYDTVNEIPDGNSIGRIKDDENIQLSSAVLNSKTNNIDKSNNLCKSEQAYTNQHDKNAKKPQIKSQIQRHPIKLCSKSESSVERTQNCHQKTTIKPAQISYEKQNDKNTTKINNLRCNVKTYYSTFGGCTTYKADFRGTPEKRVEP
ncbi:unnamed protein product, partial [Trichobilharzia regenti]